MAYYLTLAALTCAGVSEALLRRRDGYDGFIKALEFKHRLRVCNAYPYSSSLDIFCTKESRQPDREPKGAHFKPTPNKLTERPMAYKTCRDFVVPLKPGDKLEFKIGDASAGTFAVSDLPNNDAVLLLIVHRHDQMSAAVTFESHVFANMVNAQIAIIDTYKGSQKATPRIKAHGDENSTRSEELRYDSIVAVRPGIYDVELDAADGEVKARSKFVALSRESYVILRTGAEAKMGPSYPQELVIYPKSDPAMLHNGIGSHRILSALSVMLLALFAS